MRLIFVLLLSFWCKAHASTSGTGFFVSGEGHILTNYHVVEGSSRVIVRTVSGIEHSGRVLRVDRLNDLALIKIDAKTRPLHIRGSNELRPGDKVYTIGFPNPMIQGLNENYTNGVISSLSGLRDEASHMQVSVPLQPGNSGGPLLNDNGSVVGVVVSKIDTLKIAESHGYIPENVGYAIKGDYAIPLISDIPAAIRGNSRISLGVDHIRESVVLIVSEAESLKRSPNSDDSPLGLRMGMTEAELFALGDFKKYTSGNPFMYFATRLQNGHPDFASYHARLTPKQGLCQLYLVTHAVSTNLAGDQLRSKFAAVKKLLIDRYGQPTGMHNYLKGDNGSVSSNNWMQDLKDKRRALSAYWTVEHAKLPNSLKYINVTTEAEGLDEGKIVVVYEYQNSDECFDYIRESERPKL